MEKTRRSTVTRAGLALAAVLALLAPGFAEGKALLHEDFSAGAAIRGGRDGKVRELEGRKGLIVVTTKKGRHRATGGMEYGSVAVSPKGGAIQLLIARQDPGFAQDFLLRVDGGFRVYAEWRTTQESSITIEGIHKEKDPGHNDLVWGVNLPMGFNAPVGRWMVLTLTWGPDPGSNRVYVDGQPLTARAPAGLKPRLPDFSSPPAVYLGVDKPHVYGKGSKGWTTLSTQGTLIGGIAVDNQSLSPAEVAARAAAWTAGPAVAADIASLGHDADRVAGFSGALVAGDTVTVTMEGTPGAEAAFDVARLADRRGEIPVSWKGWGVYLEDITFFEEDQVDLGDVEEYRVYASPEPIDVGAITVDTPFAEALEVEEQNYTVDAVFVPVDGGEDHTREFLLPDTPYYVAVMALMDDDTFLPINVPRQGMTMTEVEGAPGTYEGTYTVGYEDRYPEAVIVGRLGSGDAAVMLASDEFFEVDPALTIEVVASPEDLKADEKSTSKVTVTVTDANEDPVPDHELRFVLATTSQYTGVVGGGAFAEEIGGTLEEDFRGETDMFGRVTATYTAGFAAKTAIIVARDMQSSDTGVGFVKTYINATAQLELEAVQQTAGKALGYTITVTSSDEWLTADGESEARITAFVAQDGIPVEGHRVGFTVSAGTGKIRTVRGQTDANGKARAVYTAGRKIGVVLIRATDHNVPGLTGTVQIELRSDAPAKIAVTVTPEVLPADGRSTADVAVVVTDINDNPNEGVEVEYVVAIGSGRMRDVDPVTDRRGESAAEYVAGRLPGKVSIEVTVRSTVPTEEELLEARELATTVADYDFF